MDGNVKVSPLMIGSDEGVRWPMQRGQLSKPCSRANGTHNREGISQSREILATGGSINQSLRDLTKEE